MLPPAAFMCYTEIMSNQEFPVTKKSRGRPKGKTAPETVPVRVPVDAVRLVDEWIEKQPAPKPGRPEAVGRLIEAGVKRHGQDD
jgi:hypothetical protein